jgi:hypothetical protein
MPHRLGYFNRFWNSVKAQIVQDVPQDLKFCEFHCPRAQCTLELTGSCDIRPRSASVFIMPAPANARPEWVGNPALGACANPTQVA